MVNKRKIAIIVGVLFVVLLTTLIVINRNRPTIPIKISYFWYSSQPNSYPQLVTIEYREAKEGDLIELRWEHNHYEVDIEILKFNNDSVLVEFKGFEMFPPWVSYPYEETLNRDDGVHFWVDEVRYNWCYAVTSLTDEGGFLVLVNFNVDESEDRLSCGFGKELYVWESGDDYELGLVKYYYMFNVVEWETMINNPMSTEEVLEYMEYWERGKCLSIVMVEGEESWFASDEELLRFKEAFPTLPVCARRVGPYTWQIEDGE